MGIIRQAYTVHAALVIEGMKNNYDLDELPNEITHTLCPCIFPILPNAGEGDGQMYPTTTEAVQADLGFSPSFRVLVVQIGETRGLSDMAPDVLDIYENYIRALRENRDLSDHLGYDPVVRHPTFGVFDLVDGTSYYGFTISHTWQFLIDD